MKTLPEYLFAEESIPHCQNQPKDRINLARGRNGHTELVSERHDDVVADDWSPERAVQAGQPAAGQSGPPPRGKGRVPRAGSLSATLAWRRAETAVGAQRQVDATNDGAVVSE